MQKSNWKIYPAFVFLSIFFVGVVFADKVFAQSSKVVETAKTLEGRARVSHIQSTDPSHRSDFFISSTDPFSAQNYFYSSIIQLKFDSNAIGFSWPKELEQYEAEDGFLQLKYLYRDTENTVSGQWSEWLDVWRGHLSSRVEPERIFSDLIFLPSAEKIILRSNQSSVLEGVEVIYINSTDGPYIGSKSFDSNGIEPSVASYSLASTTSSAKHAMPLDIISRAEWGADESYRFSNGEELWPVEYADIKKIVLHETDGYNGGDNPAATVRGVYHWHAKTLGWGDIGYNYLIDQYGNIYEGRYGGDGAVGGHVYYDYSDPETKIKLGYNLNIGSIGIAILGSYDTDIPTAQMQTALSNLVFQKALDFDIDPNSITDLWTLPIKVLSENDNSKDPSKLKTAIENSAAMFKIKGIDYEFDFSDMENPTVTLTGIPNFIGHKDIDYKSDPQQNLELTFKNARKLASQMYWHKLAEGIKQKATLISQSATVLKLNQGQSTNFWVKFRNDGETTWHNYTEQKTYLASSDIQSHMAQLSGYRFAAITENYTPNNSYNLDNANVQPGEEVKVSWTITAPKKKARDEKKYVLVLGDAGYFPGTEFTITVMNLDLATADYSAEFVSQSFSPAIFDNYSSPLKVKYRNIGIKTWEHGEIKLYIKNNDSKNPISPFKAKSWKKDTGAFDFLQDSVAPDEEATFVIPISIASPGLYNHKLYLTRMVMMDDTSVVLGEEKVIGSEQEFSTRVDPVFGAEIVSTDLPIAMLNIWNRRVSIEFKNTGLSSWKGRLMLLNDYQPEDVRNSFWGNDWQSYEIIKSKNVDIENGESVRFEFDIDAPKEPALYSFAYSLKIGKNFILIHNKKQQTNLIRIDEAK